MKRFKPEGILLERLVDKIKKYRNRDPNTVYVHMLDRPVWKALVDEDMHKVITPATLIGELAHSGLDKLLKPARQVCRPVPVPDWIPYKADWRVVERFVHGERGNYHVILCGSADALYEENGKDYPVELKTTRRNVYEKLPEEWIRRPALYAWLYNVEKGFLIVINVINGEERDIEISAYSDEKMKWIMKKWLLGEWPQRTLPSYRRYR